MPHRGHPDTLSWVHHLLRSSVRPALVRIVDACLIPTALYICGLHLGSIWWGLLASTTWTCSRLLARHLRHKGTSTHALSASACLVRLLIAFLLASPALWAIQGVAQTFVAGIALFSSSLLGRVSLLDGALRDVLPALQHLLGAAHTQFARAIGVLFGAQQVLLAMVNVGLMRLVPLETYLAVRPFVGYALALPTVGLALLVLRRHAHRASATRLV